MTGGYGNHSYGGIGYREANGCMVSGWIRGKIRMKCIDFRVRPLIDGYRAMVKNKTTETFLTAFRCQTPASVREQSVELLLREMDEAGVDLAVVPGRRSGLTKVSNEALVRLMEEYPERFSVFPLYDPERPRESLQEIVDLTQGGPCLGVSIEPGFGNSLCFDSEEYQPLYEYMNRYHLPLLATFSGSITPVLDASLPGRFQKVAKQYPGITMIAGHGGWPWFREMCCIAFFTSNVFLLPDLYSMHCPGEEDVRLAANYMLREKMLFGSSYPLLPLAEAVDHVRGWDLFTDSRELFLCKNAESILGAARKNKISL